MELYTIGFKMSKLLSLKPYVKQSSSEINIHNLNVHKSI